MQVRVLTLGIALLLVTPVAAAFPFPGTLDAVRATGMWPAEWMWDVDEDRVDDRLKGATGLVRVVVDYAHHPTNADVAALEAVGFDTDYRAKFVDSVTGSVHASRLPALAELPGVVRVEKELEYHAANNVGTQAIKARPGGTYADAAWDDLGVTGAGVTIAVLDTGVDDHQHEAFTGKFVCGYNAVDDVEENPDDGNQHGTHVAGTALGHGGNAAYPFGTHAGSAPDAKLVDVKVLTDGGSSSGSSVLRGIEWVIENHERCGIDVLTLSLGSLFSDDGTSSDAQAINRASAAGLIATIAVGNHQTFLDDFGIASPASADTAISVGAMNDRNTVTRGDDTIAGFSNTGPRPSDGDADTADEQKPEVVAPGQNIRSATYDTTNGYSDLSGTSMATPMMAGVVALMLEANPDLAWNDVEDVLVQTSEDYGTTGWDGSYGHGYVDAHAAVAEALARGDPPAPNTPPTACFTANESSAGTVHVDGACSTDEDGAVTAHAWDFGDGSTATGATATHTYAAAGSYTITLTVTDDDGATATTTQDVTVQAPPNAPPEACFTHATSAREVSVDAACSSDADGTIASYAWDFGDGSTATGATATHTYAEDGTFTVTLTVTDDEGTTATTTSDVTVTADPDPGAVTLTSGESYADTIQGAGSEKYYKILVPAGASALDVVLDGPSCGVLSCNPDLDLYVRQGARPTDTAYDCRPYTGSSDESCTLDNPVDDWWFVRVKVYGGSSEGAFTVTATVS